MKDKQYRILQENFKKFLYEENQVQVPIFLYHIAKKEDEAIIKQQGLIANTGDTTDTAPGRIYFTPTLQAATLRYKKFLQEDPTYQGAVAFKIDTSKLQGVAFYRDPKNDGIYTNADIPKEAIASVSRFGGTTTQVANEMAIAPQDVKIFPGQNYSTAKLSGKIEQLIDDSINYLNSGKKGKKPIGLSKTSVKGNEITLVFLFTDTLVSADGDLSQLLTMFKKIDSWKNRGIEKEEGYDKAMRAWQKIRNIVSQNYIDAGWSDFNIGLYNNRDKEQGFALDLIK